MMNMSMPTALEPEALVNIGTLTSTSGKPLLSVVIKTLNEAGNIARTIQSARSALGCHSAEIVVADSYSDDDTVQIALSEGAQVVQLQSKADRSCGVGAQLGYQYAQGEFILLLDGDMDLIPGFVEAALQIFESQQDVAAVGGRMQEMAMDHPVFAARMQRNQNYHVAGDVGHLDGGGMYRKKALDDVGYFTNPNLHSYEELELGSRLRARNWRVLRIDQPAIRHYGHVMPRYQLLMRRFKSRYAYGPGEFLRASLGTPSFWLAVRTVKAYLVTLVTWLALGISLLVLPWTSLPLLISVAMFIALFGMLIFKRKSFPDGVFTLVSWSVFAMAMVMGFLRRQRNPQAWVDSRRITELEKG